MAILAKDIAKELNVSTATLSLVLNGKPGISDRTRTELLARIRDLGYGDMIKEQENKTEMYNLNHLGFVIFKNSGQLLGMNSFFPLILEGVETTARRYGYNLTVINIERTDLERQIQYIKDSKCSGYVIFATELKEEDLIQFEELGIPFVIFDNYFVDKQINSVKVNNEQGTFLAVRHLYELGHRKVGYVSSGLDINSFKEREICAKNAMRQFGMEEPEQYSVTVSYPIESAEYKMDLILQGMDKNKMPTAFLTDNDLVAIGVIKALKKNGYQVPRDISVIGYDDRPISELTEPTITTIRVPRDYFGAEAIERLVHAMQSNNMHYSKTEINGELVKRESTAEKL